MSPEAQTTYLAIVGRLRRGPIVYMEVENNVSDVCDLSRNRYFGTLSNQEVIVARQPIFYSKFL
jgi:hypothetical protein